MRNSVSAVTLMTTKTALKVALSLVPTTSNVVTKPTTTTAGRLMRPPTSPALQEAPLDLGADLQGVRYVDPDIVQ